MTSINSNITSTIANNINNLRLKSARNTYTVKQTQQNVSDENIYNNVRKNQNDFTQTSPILNRFSENDILEMKEISKSMGENLTDEDICYALKYGRSVIADYSV